MSPVSYTIIKVFMEKPRILFLCPQPLWPINTGARLRNFHLANALGATCDVTILQITSPGEPLAPQTPAAFQQVLSVARSKSYTPAKMLRGLIGPMPVTVLNYTSETVAQVLAQTLAAAPYDAVQVESIHLFRYLETIRGSKNPPVALLDWHNIESELMRRYAESARNAGKKLIAARTARLLHQLEDKALASFAAHTVVSDREKEKLLARAPRAQIHVIPNGVDTAAFERRAESGQAESDRAHTDRRTLLFVGSMDYHANSDAVIWFCREIWPQLAAEFPTVDFKIVGRNPPATVQALASARILVTGTVDDVRPFYHKAFAVIVPLRTGGGTRLKILEAMAGGVPVISTRLGAEGLEARDQREILLADSAADMAASIRALFSQPELRKRLCDAARELVQAHYDWSVLGEKLASVYRSLKC
jgi:sugar transferase (PEP-CTERM/EpsH1 system associated)